MGMTSMTDEGLIKRLRLYGSRFYHESGFDFVADRIEQLVKERDAWVGHAKAAIWTDSEELKLAEAKLAKAAEALRKLVNCVDDGCYCSELQMESTMDEACAVLAELEKTE